MNIFLLRNYDPNLVNHQCILSATGLRGYFPSILAELLVWELLWLAFFVTYFNNERLHLICRYLIGLTDVIFGMTENLYVVCPFFLSTVSDKILVCQVICSLVNVNVLFIFLQVACEYTLAWWLLVRFSLLQWQLIQCYFCIFLVVSGVIC